MPPTIGPQLPPSEAKRKREGEDESSDSDSDGMGPQPPSKTSKEGVTAKKPKVVMGSLLPPRDLKSKSKRPTPKASDADESDDDDEAYGPSLPSIDDASLAANKPIPTSTVTSATSSAPTKRDEWMTMAPKTGDWSQRVDPTKLKNRKFTSGNSTGSKASDAWHETPEQKQARLQREVLGIKTEKSPGDAPKSASLEINSDETARRMREYNAQRGPSLYDSHQQGKTGEEDDDPSARAFDREKDIGGGVQLNASRRNDMVKKSANFSSRFSTAKYL